ncbi:MAG: thioesterase family protein [Planctomycetales bacterium]
MNQPPRIGTIGERSFQVERLHAIEFDGGLAVLSTPWLIWFLEHAALDAAAPSLEPGEITVGTHVDVEHLAPTPVGRRVVCVARVIHTEGPVLSFQLEARDEHETIAKGSHKRRVVRCDKFAQRVQKKSNAPN